MPVVSVAPYTFFFVTYFVTNVKWTVLAQVFGIQSNFTVRDNTISRACGYTSQEAAGGARGGGQTLAAGDESE